MSRMTKDAITIGPWTLPLEQKQREAIAIIKGELIEKGRTFGEFTTGPGPNGEPGRYTMTIPVNQPQTPEHAVAIAVSKE
jgi:hypothetical protein